MKEHSSGIVLPFSHNFIRLSHNFTLLSHNIIPLSHNFLLLSHNIADTLTFSWRRRLSYMSSISACHSSWIEWKVSLVVPTNGDRAISSNLLTISRNDGRFFGSGSQQPAIMSHKLGLSNVSTDRSCFSFTYLAKNSII